MKSRRPRKHTNPHVPAEPQSAPRRPPQADVCCVCSKPLGSDPSRRELRFIGHYRKLDLCGLCVPPSFHEYRELTGDHRTPHQYLRDRLSDPPPQASPPEPFSPLPGCAIVDYDIWR
jgi:hypothetical protein